MRSVLKTLRPASELWRSSPSACDVNSIANKVSPGAREVSPGVSEVSTSASKINPGASQVSPGVGNVSRGASEASPSVSEVSPGAIEVSFPGLSEGSRRAVDIIPSVL